MQSRNELDKKMIEITKLEPSELASAKNDQRKYALDSKHGAYVPHVFFVFNDDDFKNDILELREKLENLYYKDISLTTEPSDPHLIAQDRKRIKEVADKYCITFDDLGFYADGHFENGELSFGKRLSIEGGFIPGFHYSLEHLDGHPCYVIGPKTTLKDIQDDWPEIAEWRSWRFTRNYTPNKSATRRKSPENPELVYAIFKARRHNKKYSEIYVLYSKGKLDNYHGNTSQFNDEESLERYYRKYMPEAQDNQIFHYSHEQLQGKTEADLESELEADT